MALFNLLRFITPNAGVAVSEAGSDLTTTAALGQAVENLDTYAFRLNGSNTMAIGSDATGDIWYRNAGGLFTRLAIGTSAQYLAGGTTPSWVIPVLAVIGPTFATSTTTMTNSGTFYTGATLGSALAAGGAYLLKGGITVLSVNSVDNITVRLYDTTNSVEIWSDTVSSSGAGGRVAFTPCVEYSGYAGTPSILIQAINNTSAAGSIGVTATGGAANKATFVSGLRYA